MSATVDDRIVQLEFDNGQFERGVAQSLTTLDKLKGSLNMDSAAKNLTALSNASSHFNLNGISEAVEQVGEKFSYMKYAGLVALSNIVTGAMDAGKKIVSALTSPIITGGWNRAMNLEQANFMMKGLLKTDDAVAAVMRDVNESVDGTAYSLDAAAKVAAQFAASGVKAGENMLPSLKAVAGTAAMTNSSFEEIGQIFTTVAGQGKLMTYQMRQLEFRGLNVAATLGEQMGKTEAQIRDMVTKGTISFDMFSDAMNAAFGEHAKEANNTFQGALSNVRAALGRIGAEFATPFIHNVIPVLNSFRLAINATKATLTPFFEESSSLMESLSKKLSGAIDGYTKFVKKYGDTIKGIFKDVIGTAKNLARFLGEAIAPIKEAFNNTFEKKTLAFVKKIAVAAFTFSETLTVTSEQAERLKHIFKGFFSIFDTVGYVIRQTASALSRFSPIVKDVINFLGNGLDKVASKLLDLNSKVKSTDFFSDKLLKIPEKFKEIWDSIPQIGDRIKEGFERIKTAVSEAFSKHLVDPDKFLSNVEKVKEFFSKLFNGVKDILSGLGDLFEKMISGLPHFTEAIVHIVEALFSGLANAIQGFLNSQTIKDLMKFAESGLFLSILNNIRNFAEGLKKSGASGIVNNLFNFAPKFSAVDLSGLKDLATTLKQFTSEFLDLQALRLIGPIMLEIAAAMLIISSIDKDKVVVALGAMSGLMAEMAGVAAVMTKLEGTMPEVNILTKSVNMFSEIAKGILLLSVSLMMLSKIEPARLAGAMTAITILMGMMLFVSSKVASFVTDMNKTAMLYGRTSKKMDKLFSSMAKLMMKFATSILILAGALKLISTIPFSNLIDSLIAITVIMGEMVGATAILSKLDTTGKVGKVLTKMAMSLLILSAALKIMSTIPLEQMQTALLGLSVSLLAMTIALRMLGKVDYISLAVGGKALSQLAFAMLPLAAALKIMSTISFEEMAAALMGLVTSLTAMTIVLKVLSMGSSDFKSGAASLLIFSAALLVLSGALKVMGSLGFEGMTAALMGLVVGVAAMTIALSALGALQPSKLIAAASAFVIMSVGIMALAGSLKVLGGINDITGPIIMFTTALLAMIVAMGALSLINPAQLLATSAAIAIFGVSMLALASALAVVAAFPFKSLISAVGALSIALVAMGLIFAGLSVVWAPVLGGALVLAGVIAILAAGFAVLGASLIVVGKGFEGLALGITALSMAFGVMKENADTIKSMILPLAGMVALFGILSPLLAVIGVALGVVGLGVILIGAGAVVAGAGMMVMATAMGLIAKNIEAFALSLLKAGDILANSSGQISVLVTVLAVLGVTAIFTAAPLLVLGVALIALGAGLTLVGTGLTLTAAGINLFIMALTNLAEFLQVAIPLIKEGLAKAFEFLKEKIRAAWEFIKNIDWEAVKEGLAKFGAWIKEKAAALWDWLKQQFPIWMDALKNKLAAWGESLKAVLHEKWEALKATIQQKWEEFKGRMGQWKNDLLNTGRNIIQGLIDGMTEKIRSLTDIPKQIYDKIVGGIEQLFDINSPSKVTYWDGMMTGEGFNMGLEESTEKTGSIIDNLGDIVTGGFDGIIGAVKNAASTFSFDWSKAAEESETSLSHLMTEFANGNLTVNEFNGTVGKSWDRVKVLTDELNRLTGEYKAGRMSTEEYKAACSNLENEIYDLIGDVNTLKAALGSIDSQMKLTKSKQDELTLAYRSGKMGLHEYTEQYNRYQKELDTCTEMQRNIRGAIKDTGDAAEKTSGSMEGLAESTGKAGKASKSATQEMQEGLQKTLESQLNIFDKFEAKAAMSKEELLNNMKSQIDGMASWAANMDKLSAMGIDKGLYQKLAEMGPQGAQYVGAFVNMTSEEMARANEMWAQSLVLPGDIAGKLTANYQAIGTDVNAGLASGIAASQDQPVTAAEETADAVTEATKTKFDSHSPSRVFINIGFWIDVGLAQGILQNMGHVNNAIHTMASVAISTARNALAPDVFKPIGAGISEGIQQGIDEKKDGIFAALDEIAKKAIDTMKKALDERSPSHIFMGMGEYVSEGFAIGINNKANMVYGSVDDLANNTIDAMKYTIATIASTIQDGIEDPVITPVLDLSKVQAGVRTINSSFSATQAYKTQSALAGLQNGEYVGNGNVIFNQNNYSPKALSRIEIYRDTRNLFAQAKGALS